MQLQAIWRYPVKSMIGGVVESAELALDGIVGDRIVATADGVWKRLGAR